MSNQPELKLIGPSSGPAKGDTNSNDIVVVDSMQGLWKDAQLEQI